MRVCSIALFIVSLICEMACAQQVVVMRDGRYFEGETLRRVQGGIIFRTRIANVDADLELKTSEISSIRDLVKLQGTVVGQVAAVQSLSADVVSVYLSPDLSRLEGIRFIDIRDHEGNSLHSSLEAAEKGAINFKLSVKSDGKPFEAGFESDKASQSLVKKSIDGVRIFVSRDGKSLKQYDMRQGTMNGYSLQAVSASQKLVLIEPDRAPELPFTTEQQSLMAKLVAEKEEELRKLAELEEQRRQEEAAARAKRKEEQKRAQEEQARRQQEEAMRRAEAARKAEEARQAMISERKRLIATGNQQDIVKSFKSVYDSFSRSWSVGGGRYITITSYDVTRSSSLVSPYEGKIQGMYYGPDGIDCLWKIHFRIENGDWVSGVIECCKGGMSYIQSELADYIRQAGCE